MDSFFSLSPPPTTTNAATAAPPPPAVTSAAPEAPTSNLSEPLQHLQQLDLLSLVQDLLTRVQNGTVTAKTIENEAGFIRSRIYNAKTWLTDLESCETQDFEREIAELENGISRKRELLRKFLVVMGQEQTDADKQKEVKEEDSKVDMKSPEQLQEHESAPVQEDEQMADLVKTEPGDSVGNVFEDQQQDIKSDDVNMIDLNLNTFEDSTFDFGF